MKIRKSNLNTYRLLSYGSCGLLGIIILALLCPITPSPARATVTTTPDSATGNTSTKVYVKSSISIAVEPNTTFEIIPNPTNATGHGSSTITVNTNNRTGYGLWLRAVNADLHNRDLNTEDVIHSLPDDTVASLDSPEFGANQWGYSLNGTTYSNMPTTSTMVENQSSATANQTHTLTIGAKVDASLPAGEYHGTIEISAVANPITVLTLSDIDTMQEMTSAICAATAEGETKSLTDTRDKKSYHITKLKDGNCWMTENLKYSLSSTVALTPDDSDVATSWTPKSSTRTSSNGPSDVSNSSLYSWSFNGRWYYQWLTANANAQNVTEYQDAFISNSSICPKGWKLPTAGVVNSINVDATNGSFHNLLNAYGLSLQSSSAAGTYDVYQPDNTMITSTVTANQYSITGQPLYFTTDGYAAYDTATNKTSAQKVGEIGRYLSSVSNGTVNFRALYFDASKVTASNNVEHTAGLSVRCLAR